jgi:hypothetical protein
MDCCRSGGFSVSQTPPSSSCATSEESCRKTLKTIGNPLVFFSRKLTDTESLYSTFDCELLAAQAAIKHFRYFCEVGLFQLWTDHKPLVTALSRVSTPISPRQQRHLAFISEFNVQLLYLPGLKNVIPTTPPPHWNRCCHSGGRSSGFRGDGRRTKPLPRKAAFARWHIS